MKKRLRTGLKKTDMTACTACPRKCGADRTKGRGVCGAGESIAAARAMPHFGEEPCISGRNGSGAIFFSGCSLKCCFCQNFPISRDCFGTEISEDRLGEIMLELCDKGVHNINLVNPTHFTPQIRRTLEKYKPRLGVPVVWNSGGYELAQTLETLDGLVDIYLPDVKYISREAAGKYSAAPDYTEYAFEAVCEMHRQCGKPVFDGDIMKKGLIIRHLVLPNGYHDSIAIMERLAELLPRDEFLVSVMRQYTPCGEADRHKEINRRLTTFEYRKVLDACERLGLDGFSQEKGSDTLEMTPDFNLEGII